jgi:flavin-binding protein dodecin
MKNVTVTALFFAEILNQRGLTNAGFATYQYTMAFGFSDTVENGL